MLKYIEKIIKHNCFVIWIPENAKDCEITQQETEEVIWWERSLLLIMFKDTCSIKSVMKLQITYGL